MRRHHATLLSLLAGAVALLVVGVAVTELLASRVWPSLLVGIPAGLVAGTVTTAVVWRWLRRRTASTHG
jgi:hypothetical protein